MPADPLLTLDHASPIVTIQGHLLEEQARIPGSTGALSWILSAMSITAKMYFGAVGVKRTRHALPACLLADVVGITTAIVMVKAW